MAGASKKVEQALNDQLHFEIYSGYIYWAMAAYFEAENLPGFARWMIAQYGEEMAHARKFYSFILERGGRAELQAIDKPTATWESPLAAFQQAYAHECEVTKRIYKIADLARDEGDYATIHFLQWFFGEQVEEEKSTDEIVQLLKAAAGHHGAMFMLDHQLGQRKFGD